MPKTSLEQLQKLAAGFDNETLTKTDFEGKMQRVLALIQRLIQNVAENAARAEAKADTALRAVAEQHNLSLSELKSQTNQLFVGERLDEMSEVTKASFAELQDLLDEKGIAIDDKLLSVQDGLTPSNDELLALISPLVPKVPDLTKLKKAFIKHLEDFKKLKERFGRFDRAGGGSRFFGGPNANAVLIHIVSDQCDGENRRFTMPMARRVYKFEMSQHPFNLYEDTSSETHGFTVGDRFIELDNTVPAPKRGQSAAVHYLK